MKVRVTVSLKAGVLDPQGRSITQTLHQLGFAGVHGARVSKMIELDVAEDTTEEQVADMARKLLANTVIEDFRITFP